LAINLTDDRLPGEQILDDEGELQIDGKTFPAVAFTLGPMAEAKALAVHPGDAAGALAALGKAKQLTVRSTGVGVDSGPITLQLPSDALDYLKNCGKQFNIAIDRPTDPDAADLPVPRPPSPRVAMLQPTSTSMPGIEDIQKIQGWDASELRAPDGTVDLCYLRRRYSDGSGTNLHVSVTALMVDRASGFRIVLKDSGLHMTDAHVIEGATLTASGKPFQGFVAKPMSVNEIALFPVHGKELAAALDTADDIDFKSKVVGIEFPMNGGAVGWSRACARRNGFPMEPGTE
jgi:hypothetical protein